MFRQVLNRLLSCVSSGLRIRCSPNHRLASLLKKLSSMLKTDLSEPRKVIYIGSSSA